MSAPPRLMFLDNLRALAIVLVVVLHASITYMAFAPECWYVLDPRRSLLFTAIVLLLDVPLILYPLAYLLLDLDAPAIVKVRSSSSSPSARRSG